MIDGIEAVKVALQAVRNSGYFFSWVTRLERDEGWVVEVKTLKNMLVIKIDQEGKLVEFREKGNG